MTRWNLKERSLKPECDQLEDRRCPSVATPSTEIPTMQTDAYAVTRHLQDLAVAAQDTANVVFYGDSITDWFATGAGKAVWNAKIAPLGAADFGVAADGTEDVLGRIDSGEVVPNAKVAVVMIGTNDLAAGDSVADVAAGIEKIVSTLRADEPGTKILLLGILPRGMSATDPYRAEIAAVNAQISTIANGDSIRYMDIGGAWLEPDGSINPAMTIDGWGLHPSALGYESWADQIGRVLRDMLASPLDVANPTPARSVETSTVSVGPVAPTPTAAPAAAAAPVATSHVATPSVAKTTPTAAPATSVLLDPAPLPDAGEYVAPSITTVDPFTTPATPENATPALPSSVAKLESNALTSLQGS